MRFSQNISELVDALVDFNAEITSISKDGKNPFFRSSYVTLDNLIENTRPLLQKNGLVVIQTPLACEDGRIGIETGLFHKTGEFMISDPIYMTPAKLNDPQAAGSVISYMRRYSYQAILNLNTGEDDDGNRASRPSAKSDGKAPKTVDKAAEEVAKFEKEVEGKADINKENATTEEPKQERTSRRRTKTE